MAENTDVLVEGAGPIGLVNAWAIKQLNPNLNVVVLEKHGSYKRKHTLRMKHEHLAAIMKATDSEKNPILVQLLADLKIDPRIRTNKLQDIFTQLCDEVKIKKEIKYNQPLIDKTVKTTLATEYPNVRLIIGAGGTHSVVSQALYPAGNQVKQPYDYVLQLRFEIKSKEQPTNIEKSALYQEMARKGLIASEDVGRMVDGRTPVTVQMMISEDDFKILKEATFKHPLKPFAKDSQANQNISLPPHLQTFITNYLGNRIKQAGDSERIEREELTLSVNEAPATYTKQVVHIHNQARVILMGDAALGLSYFIGLNAGLEATAIFLSKMKPVLQDGLTNLKEMDQQLKNYQTWFLTIFSPKKVKEVGQYSFWNIRSAMQAIRAVRSIKTGSVQDFEEDLGPGIEDYLNLEITNDLPVGNKESSRLFPHRPYDLVRFGQFADVPFRHTAKKIAKIFTDFFKPYKSYSKILQDFKQPLVGIGNFSIGVAKTISGIFRLKGHRFADGLFHMLRGIIELVTTPLAWVLKPLTRIIATLVHGGFKKIEENTGIQHLVQEGQQQLNNGDPDVLEDRLNYQLRALCNDIHRKFSKSTQHGQRTKLEVEEHLRYSAIRASKSFNNTKFKNYFSLFSLPQETHEPREEDLFSTTNGPIS